MEKMNQSIISDSSTKNSDEKNTIKQEVSPDGEIEKPSIVVEPTIVRPQLFLAMKEETNSENEAQSRLKNILSNLTFIQQKHHLKRVAAPAAWRQTLNNSFIVEGGVVLEEKLPVNETGTYYKRTKRCSAVVAHFFGKRSFLSQAYDELYKWVKENNKQAIGTPWEVYESESRLFKLDYGSLQTDVYLEFK
jgi:hypothetical protein